MAQIAVTTSGQGEHRDERNLLGGSEKSGEAAAGGTNETRRVELDNGVTGYHKPFSGLDHGLARGFGHDDAQQPIHEVAAWRVARELGEPWDRLVAPVVLREFNGEMGSFALERPGIPHRRPGDVDPGEAKAAAFFDCLIGQQDRHPGNYLAQGDRLTLIDHGYSFARSGDILNWSFLQRDRVRSGEVEKRLSGPEITALDKFLDSEDSLGLAGVLTPDRLEAMRDRAERMRRSGELLLHGDY